MKRKFKLHLNPFIQSLAKIGGKAPPWPIGWSKSWISCLDFLLVPLFNSYFLFLIFSSQYKFHSSSLSHPNRPQNLIFKFGSLNCTKNHIKTPLRLSCSNTRNQIWPKKIICKLFCKTFLNFCLDMVMLSAPSTLDSHFKVQRPLLISNNGNWT